MHGHCPLHHHRVQGDSQQPDGCHAAENGDIVAVFGIFFDILLNFVFGHFCFDIFNFVFVLFVFVFVFGLFFGLFCVPLHSIGTRVNHCKYYIQGTSITWGVADHRHARAQ